MRASIHGKGASPGLSRAVRRALEDASIGIAPPSKGRAGAADCAVVLGGDKGVRSYFQGATPDVPVLGIGEAESGGFLAQIDAKELPSYAARLKKGAYMIDEVPRIGVSVDGRAPHPALNDVAVFPSRSATLMEHTLRIDGDEVWHDSSDGVVISTPMGSSGYHMSAGGPAILANSQVFGIVSVNSLDVTRRPMIVSERSTMSIDDISAMVHCEAVIDGIARHPAKKSVSCTRLGAPARLIRLKPRTRAAPALEKKVRLAEDLLKMPSSAKLILTALQYSSYMTTKEIMSRTMLPERTVSMALKNLRDNGHIRRRVSMRDARQKIYEIVQPD